MLIKDTLFHFSQPLLGWYHQHGRKNLPWQQVKDAYRIWISEIMLQQTQVQTVIPFFERFIARFPTVQSLSEATEDEVLAYWSGLGYYSRARNLLKAAQTIMSNHQGRFPDTEDALMQLPGIGASTAAAIASLAFDKPAAILDANVKRVLSRYFMVEGLPHLSEVNKKLWELAQACMPTTDCASYTQAIMDLGAMICTSKHAQCKSCPLDKTCQAYQNQMVNQFPFKAIKKLRPVKKEQFLLLYSEKNEIYLEKRPSPGIWGGLWSLPAIGLEEDPASFIKLEYDLHCSAIESLIDIKHTFTHFHLHIKALALKTEGDIQQPLEKKGQWFAAMECGKLGLAKPVRDIINHFICCF
jgi:A/G-specific adenine glycosylase